MGALNGPLGRSPLYSQRLARCKAEANLPELELFNAIDAAVAAVSRIEIDTNRYYGSPRELGADRARQSLQESSELILVEKIEARLSREHAATENGARVI